MSTTPEEFQRRSALQSMLRHATSRRIFLKQAAAAGLVPVLSTETVMARRAAQEPAQGGAIVVLGHHAVDTLSPDNDGETVMLSVCSQMFDSLYFVNETYELEPSLATGMETSEDGLTYTFTLHEGVTFHNGDAFSSEDVKYTFDWIMDEANASTRFANFELVESVEAPDPTTVVVTLSEPDATFMVNVPTTLIYPAAYHAEIGEDAFKGEPIGTGPFRLTEWIPAQSTTLERFDDYFQGPSNIDSFRIDIVPEAAGRTAALETGQADHSVWSLNAEDNTMLKESGDFTVYEAIQRATNHFALNNTHPFLADRIVRRALLHAMDRQTLVDDIFQGQATVATANISPAIEKYYNPEVPTYDYNPDTARQLLDDAGWTEGDDGIREKDGVRAEFTLRMIQGDTQRRPIAEIGQALFAEVGVEMHIEENTEVSGAMARGEADAGLFNWTYGGSNGDPDCRETLHSEGVNNFNQFNNEEMDGLLEEGVRALEEDARRDIYNRVQEIVAEEVPMLFFLHLQGVVFYSNRVKGLPETALNTDALYRRYGQLWIEES